MSKTDTSTPSTNLMVAPRSLPSKAERFRAYGHALEAVSDKRCQRPIPRFMLDLPWADDDDDEGSNRMIAQMLASDDPYAQQSDTGTVGGKSLVGRRITAHRLAVRPSDKPQGWGAYLMLECTVGDDEDRVIVTIGAKQAVATLAYAFLAGDFPVTGTVAVAATSSKGNDVLGFVVERAL